MKPYQIGIMAGLMLLSFRGVSATSRAAYHHVIHPVAHAVRVVLI